MLTSISSTLGFVGDVFQFLGADIIDGDFNQVANHGLNVPANVADLSELRSFNFQERRIGQLRETAGDLGLTHTGRPNHDDVLGNDLLGEVRRKLLAAHTVAQSDRRSNFGFAEA
jgi:hypothetical protein